MLQLRMNHGWFTLVLVAIPLDFKLSCLFLFGKLEISIELPISSLPSLHVLVLTVKGSPLETPCLILLHSAVSPEFCAFCYQCL